MSFTYKGLTEQYSRHIVTEEEVDHQILRLRDSNPRIVAVEDRATQSGDEIVLDYAGFCDGERFAGGTAENQTLVLGSGMFIPGFEDQLIDKVPGEEVTVKVTFPKEYHAENLAGKDAEFHCVIRQIRVKTQYDLDDVFAKEVGRCETFEQMKAATTESLQQYTDQRGEMDLQDRLMRRAAATLDLEVSEEEIAQEVEQQLQAMEVQLSQQGLSLDMYCQFMNTTREQLREDHRAEAEAMIRIRAAVEKIVELEKLEPTEEEMEKAYEMVCRQNNITAEQLQEHMDEEFRKAIVNSVLTGKVMGLIRDAALVEEK